MVAVRLLLAPGSPPVEDLLGQVAHIRTSATDAETLLALGERIDFSRASLFDLELIPGISDRLATLLMLKKGEIHLRSRFFAPRDRYQAFMIVRGIGPKTAEKLDLYLRID